jgi:hypothetical protein
MGLAKTPVNGQLIQQLQHTTACRDRRSVGIK